MCPKKNPDQTRGDILAAAFAEMYQKGFQAASLTEICSRAGLTKGALYHHFPGKEALGLAVLREVVRESVHRTFVDPLTGCRDPVDRLREVVTEAFEGLSEEEIDLGCPLCNLALEMSPVDEDFRRVITGIYDGWRDQIAKAFARAQNKGLVRKDVDAESAAGFVVAALAGCRTMARNAQSREALMAGARELRVYLHSLRPPHSPASPA